MAIITCTPVSVTATATNATVTRTMYGVLNVTLPSWTFEGTGVIFDYIEETFTIRDALVYPETVIETLTADDELTLQYLSPMVVVSTFTASDETTDDRTTILVESITVEDTPSSTSRYSLASTFEVSDAVTPRITGIITETFQATDAVDHTHVVTVEETIEVTEEVTSLVQAVKTITSTFYVSGSVDQAATQETVSEALTVTDVVSLVRSTSGAITETATFEDTFDAAVRSHVATLTETTVWSEETSSAGSTFTATLESVFTADDTIWAKDFAAIAWVLNTETGGVNTYDNFGFDSLAQYNGKLYATSPDGIFELDADTDDGRQISAYYKTGFLDMGHAERKRMSDLYVGYTGGALECTIETYPGEESYTYEMQERDAEAPRNNRIRVGKGLSSRYWRFTFSNVSGADFQIQDITAEIGVSDRRL